MGHSLKIAQERDAQQRLLDAYSDLLAFSSRMLDSARASDWSSLVDQETRYLIQVERLERLDAELVLDARGCERKAALLEQLLAQDLEIRRCLLARRDQLAELIGNSRQQLALSRTYGPQQGAMTRHPDEWY